MCAMKAMLPPPLTWPMRFTPLAWRLCQGHYAAAIMTLIGHVLPEGHEPVQVLQLRQAISVLLMQLECPNEDTSNMQLALLSIASA